MTFSGMTDTEKKAYLTAITEVTVNDEAYTVSSGSISSSDADNTCKRHATNNAYDVSAYDVLQFTLNGLHDGDEVVIKANGYTDLEYTVKFTEEPTVPDDGQIEMTVAGFEKKTETSWGTQNTYYRMSFEAPATGTVSDYLKAITEVTVGEKQYSYSNSYGVSASDSTSYAINSFYDTRVKRSEVRRKLACRRIFDLGARQKHE